MRTTVIGKNAPLTHKHWLAKESWTTLQMKISWVIAKSLFWVSWLGREINRHFSTMANNEWTAREVAQLNSSWKAILGVWVRNYLNYFYSAWRAYSDILLVSSHLSGWPSWASFYYRTIKLRLERMKKQTINFRFVLLMFWPLQLTELPRNYCSAGAI